MKRRLFCTGLFAAAAGPLLAAREPSPEEWLNALRRRNGRTPSVERLGVWLQVRARERDGGSRAAGVLRELALVQERDGYLGAYGPADRLGASDRAVDEFWGTAELGRGLLECAEAGVPLADGVARKLGRALLTLSVEHLGRDPGEQHPSAAALLYFLTGMARRTGDAAYRDFLQRLPARIGLPAAKSPYAPALPPVMPGWGRDPHRAARGLSALSGAAALARHQEHVLLTDAVRERWRALEKSLPSDASAELLACWVRLTGDLFPQAGDGEREAALRRARAQRVREDEPYSAYLRAHRLRNS